MSRWFRWYEGTTEDGKFRAVARNAGVTVATVMGMWATLLEDASHPDHRGIATRGEDFYGPVLDLSFEEVMSILSAMESMALISVGHGAITITKWKDRQFETDTSDSTNADRQRRWRAKKNQTTPDDQQTERNGSVTEEKRPDTDTDTDTEKKERSSLRSLWSFEEFWKLYPHKIAKQEALKAFDVAKRSEVPFERVIAALHRYIQEKPPDRAWCNPATWIRGGRWDDEPAPLIDGNSNGKTENPHSVVAAGKRNLDKLYAILGDRPPDSDGAGEPPVRLLSQG